ncbi:hypothetical protein GCM10009679_03040 [Saccharothrix algeriensis]|uniref:Uncharacterized protein n=1 Tax=Catellatospora bangladeshensis TaxID=310355 RepID=A0A8J3JHZ1_9ACTN|nr:hypothetical protein Cba03nite_21610 [Catellatospora bangladeshensis]
MVQLVELTLAVTDTCTQVELLVGMFAWACAPPQFFIATYAADWPPPERTHALSVYDPLVRPVRVWYVSTVYAEADQCVPR